MRMLNTAKDATKTIYDPNMEKIDYVFENKLTVPKYSRLVDVSEDRKNEFNLNIRIR